jgi:hypothetical protein
LTAWAEVRRRQQDDGMLAEVEPRRSHIFGVGELVAARWTVRATHIGDFGDIPPTGLRIDVTGIAMARIVRRLLVVEHATTDTLGLLRQFGMIPFTTKLPAPLLF